MKKLSMGMMLSSLLLIPVGCGEEAPPVAAPADPGAVMSHAAEMPSHSAAPATEAPAKDAPATEAPATEAPAKDAAP